MTVPRFTDVELTEAVSADAAAKFEAIMDAAGHSAGWQTPERILVPPLYGDSDLAGLDFLETAPGIPPFLRGPYATMYVNQPWTCLLYTSDAADE